MPWGSRGLMDRALDLKPEVTQCCWFESRLQQEVSTTEVRPLSKAPNPQLLPGRRTAGCPLLHLWRFSTAWYGTVRYGTARYGSLLAGFPLGTVPGTFLVPPQPRFQANRTITKT